MNRQVLYDKEISVTLYHPPRIVEATYTSQVVQGYSQTVLDGKKLLYSQQVQKEDNPALGGTFYNVTATIEFYEGNTRKVFAGYRKKADGKEYAVYKNIRASGRVHIVNTIEDMKKGRAADGSIFQTGDIVKVKEDKSRWNVFVRGAFNPDEVNIKTDTQTTITEEEAETLTIACTKSGLKPDMSLSINLLPGQNCYGAVLKVRNLNLVNKDIRVWTRMVITAGYRTGAKASYTCPIFASYIEEPNPDGITTFEGITVGTAESVLNDQYTEIVFLQEEMTLLELTEGVAKGISDTVKVHCYIDDDIMNETIHMKKQTVYAQNGAAILNWLQTTISKFIETISEKLGMPRMSAFLQLVGDELQIIAINGPNKQLGLIENIVNLDMVSGATFNGTALTVIAPWNPALQPGGLFYMPPEFINGSKLPNTLPTEDYRNEDNLYRALTISVSFASVENENKMTVLAIPAQWVGELPSSKTTEMSGDKLAVALSRDVNIVGTKKIEVGKTGEEDTSEINNIYSAPATDHQMFDSNEGRDLLTIWGSWTTILVDRDMGRGCISKALEYYFHSYPSGPHLVPDTKGDDQQTRFYKDRDYFQEKGYQKALDHFQSQGCWSNMLWWPLTVVGTYWRKWIDDQSNISNNWATVDPKDPDKVDNLTNLYVPEWAGSWESQLPKLTQVRDIWKYAYQEYKDIYEPWIYYMWRAMYYYLGGTDELD